MTITAADIKIGMCIEMDGKTFLVVDFQHCKPGKGPARPQQTIDPPVAVVFWKPMKRSGSIDQIKALIRPTVILEHLFQQGEVFIIP